MLAKCSLVLLCVLCSSCVADGEDTPVTVVGLAAFDEEGVCDPGNPGVSAAVVNAGLPVICFVLQNFAEVPSSLSPAARIFHIDGASVRIEGGQSLSVPVVGSVYPGESISGIIVTLPVGSVTAGQSVNSSFQFFGTMGGGSQETDIVHVPIYVY